VPDSGPAEARINTCPHRRNLAVSTNSFEIAQIATSVPEPSTWAMMGLGFAGLAFAGGRARRAAVRLAV